MGAMEDTTSPTPSANGTTPDERTMAMLAHLLGIVTGFIGPLIVWLIKKDQSAFVNDQGKEALNFQITCLILYVICFILVFVLIGIFLMPLVGLYWLIFTIIAGIKANGGERYRYPIAIRLIK